MWRLRKVLILRWSFYFFQWPTNMVAWGPKTKPATQPSSPCVSLGHAGQFLSSVLNTSFHVSRLSYQVCHSTLHGALTLRNTESGLWSRPPLLVTEISAAELLWVSSAMVLSCQEGGQHKAGYSFGTTLQASHTGTEQLGCHLVDAAAADLSRLD